MTAPAQHTPGPWEMGFGATDCRWPQVESADGLIARTYGSRDEENARLIAAAPDLLAACKAALGCLVARPFGSYTVEESRAFLALRAAITRAEVTSD